MKYSLDLETRQILHFRESSKLKHQKPAMTTKPTLTTVRASFVNALRICHALSIFDKTF